MLEKQLIDRLLKSHWEYLRLYLLNEHGGLLRSAVRGFEGVKLSRFDLLSVVSDTIEVIEALKKSASSTGPFPFLLFPLATAGIDPLPRTE